MSGVATFLVSTLSSIGISIASAAWLAKQAVGHFLKKDLQEQKNTFTRKLEDHKAELGKELALHKVALDLQRDEQQAALRRQVETLLGDDAAERQYKLEARKHLYAAIGPLRFQLLLACRQAAHRIVGHAKHPYALELSGYYGRNTLFRLLRPLVIGLLIEKEIAYADFSVDPSAIRILAFYRAALSVWSGDAMLLNHPDANWVVQEQHVVIDRLTTASCALLQKQADGRESVLAYREFEDLLRDEAFSVTLEPLPALLSRLDASKTPILWLRIVAFGSVCNELINAEGTAVGFESRTFPVRELLASTGDKYIGLHLDEYEKAILAMRDTKL